MAPCSWDERLSRCKTGEAIPLVCDIPAPPPPPPPPPSPPECPKIVKTRTNLSARRPATICEQVLQQVCSQFLRPHFDCHSPLPTPAKREMLMASDRGDRIVTGTM